MTERELQELEDYGKDIHDSYSAENPASYIPRTSVRYYTHEGNSSSLTPKQLDQEVTLAEKQTIRRPIIISCPKPERNTQKRTPLLYPIIILLQRLIPRIG